MTTHAVTRPAPRARPVLVVYPAGIKVPDEAVYAGVLHARSIGAALVAAQDQVRLAGWGRHIAFPIADVSWDRNPSVQAVLMPARYVLFDAEAGTFRPRRNSHRTRRDRLAGEFASPVLPEKKDDDGDEE